MTKEERDIQRKKRVLRYADAIGDVSKSCRYFGIGRARFYRWKDALRRRGVDDLFPEMRLDFAARRGDADVGGGPDTLDAAAQAAIRARVRAALAKTAGNRTEAAKLLGVSRTKIWKYSK